MEKEKLNEAEKIIKIFFREDGTLKSLPVKEFKKIIILKQISKRFETSKEYSEQEVNDKLSQIFADHVEIRRALIDYKFFKRSQDCRSYWLINN